MSRMVLGLAVMVLVFGLLFIQRKASFNANSPDKVCREEFLRDAIGLQERDPMGFENRLKRVAELCDNVDPKVYVALCESRMKVRDLKYCEAGLDKYPNEGRLHLLMAIHHGGQGEMEDACREFALAQENGAAEMMDSMGSALKEKCPGL